MNKDAGTMAILMGLEQHEPKLQPKRSSAGAVGLTHLPPDTPVIWSESARKWVIDSASLTPAQWQALELRTGKDVTPAALEEAIRTFWAKYRKSPGAPKGGEFPFKDTGIWTSITDFLSTAWREHKTVILVVGGTLIVLPIAVKVISGRRGR